MTPESGYKAHVPLASDRFDRTDVGLKPGDLLIEAKLTETDSQSTAKTRLLAYRDSSDAFDDQQLLQSWTATGHFSCLAMFSLPKRSSVRSAL